MKGIHNRPILLSLIVIVMWIASALLLVAGFSFYQDGKLLSCFASLLVAVLLGVLGFITQLKVLSKLLSKLLSENTPNPAMDASPEEPSASKSADLETPANHIKASSSTPNLTGYTLSYSYHDVKISDFKDRNTQSLQTGDDIVFLHEKDNADDKKAVSVIVSGVKIGYLEKDRLRDMFHDFSAQNGLVLGSILSSDPLNPTMSIRYYKNNTEINEYYDHLKSGQAYKTFMLLSNKGEEMQDNISTCSIGDEVEVNYDYDEETYTAYCFEEIGVFPKSANNLLEHEFKAFVERIEQNEEDTHHIYVAVFKV